MDLNKLTIHEIRDKLDRGEVTSVAIVEDILTQLDKTEGKLHAYLEIDRDKLISEAKKKDQLLEQGKRSALLGIPITVKDNICIKGVAAGCASRILEGFISPYQATVAQKLLDNGAILIPRANMDEFAMGSSNENSYYGPACNPWDPERVPGGSSGGSCVAVASSETIAAIGSDTGGSIRQPAALCGVVGFKPTYGRISRYGLIAFASSLDQIGPITKDVTDNAIMLRALSGYDCLDSTSVNYPIIDYQKSLNKGIKGLKLGVPKEYFIEGINPEVRDAVKTAIDLYKNLGAKIKEISLPHTDYAVATYYIIATAEASSNLARYDGVQYGYRAAVADKKQSLLDMYEETREAGFGPEVKRRIVLGTYVLSSGYYDAYYLKAQKVRTLIRKDFEDAFNQVDLILTPTSPTPAFKIGERSDDPLQMYLSDIFTISANLAGVPAISIPCGFSKDNLPVGLQLLGKPFAEESILQAAFAYEQATDWHKKRPF